MPKILWSEWDDAEANNWDGTAPTIEGDDTVFIKELSCNCQTPGCGGCIDVWKGYEIGSGKRYFWKTT